MSTRLSDRPAAHIDCRWLFGLFALLLAFALLLHQLWWDGFEVFSMHFVVVVAALWTAVRPTSVARFVVMVAAEVVALAVDLPDVFSHTLLVLVSGACVLTYVGWATVRARRLPAPGALFERIAPFLRVQLLVVYAAAAVAKLNTDFVDRAVSCAAWMSRQVAWFDPSVLDVSWRVAPAIGGTVAIEVALPVLLAVPRTRVLGLVVGLGFHIVLALAGNVPFSALALALYVAFLPADTPARLRAIAADRPGLYRWAARARRWGGHNATFGIAVGCWLAAAGTFSVEPAAGEALIAHGLRLLLVGVMLAAGIVLVRSRARRGPRVPAPGSPPQLGHPVFAVGVLLLVLNSLSPYLGLKTEDTFTMFSNLHTEAGRWNHLLIPESVRVFGYQDQLVEITDSNDPALVQRSRGGSRLVRFELERYLRSHPGTSATYTTTTPTGQTQTIQTTGSSAAGSATTAVLEKVVMFKDVHPLGPSQC